MRSNYRPLLDSQQEPGVLGKFRGMCVLGSLRLASLCHTFFEPVKQTQSHSSVCKLLTVRSRNRICSSLRVCLDVGLLPNRDDLCHVALVRQAWLRWMEPEIDAEVRGVCLQPPSSVESSDEKTSQSVISLILKAQMTDSATLALRSRFSRAASIDGAAALPASVKLRVAPKTAAIVRNTA